MNSLLLVYGFSAVALSVIACIAILNALTFPRLGQGRVGKVASATPLISVLIPARDEAAVISATLTALLGQVYPHFEVIVLDDASSDGTGDLVRQHDDARLRVLNGEPLPAGWLGKNWACAQLAEAAAGDYLVFTDADVRWSPGALAALAAAIQHTQADLLTVWPTQTTVTWGERLVVPLMALAIMGYLPIWGTHYTPFSAFAAACGQCMAWRGGAYTTVGGHSAVAGSVLEDVLMARRVKRAGLRLRMLDGAGLVGCRMYTGWQSVRDGYAKNILAGYGDSVLLLLLGTIFHWLLFIMPPLLLLTSEWRWGAALTALGVGVRMLTAAASGQRVLDGLLMPLSALLMTRIAAQAVYWRVRYGAPRWKGRILTTAERNP
ncbi:MAG: glycosyltransferase [Armatimonadetes bacterium]|nr:glycosyltransferase [Anaerolineae bacterium]